MVWAPRNDPSDVSVGAGLKPALGRTGGVARDATGLPSPDSSLPGTWSALVGKVWAPRNDLSDVSVGAGFKPALGRTGVLSRVMSVPSPDSSSPRTRSALVSMVWAPRNDLSDVLRRGGFLTRPRSHGEVSRVTRRGSPRHIPRCPERGPHSSVRSRLLGMTLSDVSVRAGFKPALGRMQEPASVRSRHSEAFGTAEARLPEESEEVEPPAGTHVDGL